MIRRRFPLFLACLLACLLLVAPTTSAYATPVIQETATTYQGIVNTTANIRSGPGLQYEVVGQAQTGQSVTVVACNQDCTWLQLDNGNWIAAFLVDLVGASGESTGSGADNSNNGRTRIIDPDDLILNAPSETALEIVERILSYAGLPQSFEVYSANIYNAAALMADGERVILYDPQLIADLESVTEHDWPAVFIFAHEIGHHLAGHTLEAVYNREYELEADYFSGFILQRMGATLVEAQSVMSLLRDHPNMTDHPPQAERLAAVESGWQEAVSQAGLATWVTQFPDFASEVSLQAEAGYVPAASAGIRAVLRQTQAQQLLLEGVSSVSTVRDLNVGLKAFAR